MAKWNYDESLRRLLADEGGYSNHPSDPGGPTNWGITIIDYRKYVKPSATAADVRAMKVDEARRIYRAKYWDAESCDDLPSGVEYATFDYGVNSGIGRSGKVLRRLCDLPANTSAITDEVVAAARRRDPKALSAAICDERLRFLQSLRTWSVFGSGWGRRVAGVKVAAAAMSRRNSAPPLGPELLPSNTIGKGVIPEPKAVKHVVTKGVPTAGVGGVAGFWDSVTAHPIITLIIVAVAVGAIVVVVEQINAWHRKRQETPPADLVAVPELTA